MTYQVLIVDPHRYRLLQLDSVLRNVADMTLCQDFESARKKLSENPPDLVVTNVKLGPYNGIHLALLASLSQTRCVVYSSRFDVVLARHAQAASAFYVRLAQLPFVLPAFLTLSLPSRDRRDPAVVDRRKTFRGGRRATDVRMNGVTDFSSYRASRP